MKKVHMTLQGKGGIGKSLVASFLAQYHLENGLAVSCINTDPINATFSRYQAFTTEHFDLMAKGLDVDMSRLDTLMERLIEEDSHFVIDNGVASYLPVCNYLIGFGAVEALTKAGKQLILHVVIAGGQAILDTLENLTLLAEQMPENVQMVVWLNEHEGQIQVDGKQFEDMQAYKNNKDRILGVICITKQESLFNRDIKAMLDQFLTFDEAITGKDFRIMEKQRLTMIRRNLFEQMGFIFDGSAPTSKPAQAKKAAEQELVNA